MKNAQLELLHNNRHGFDYEYKHINHPINYTGKLLLGYKSTNMSVVGDYPPLETWSVWYKKLIEVKLSNGKIINHKILEVDNKNVKTSKNVDLSDLIKLRSRRKR